MVDCAHLHAVRCGHLQAARCCLRVARRVHACGRKPGVTPSRSAAPSPWLAPQATIGMYLESDEIKRHIESGKQAVRLALSWQDQVDFVVDKDLSLRRIRFSDELKDINEELHEDALARRDADCLLMGETLSTLQTAIAKMFGGISE